jgi:preprotein translocase subunit SecE
MATKTALVNDGNQSKKKDEPGAMSEFSGNATGKWQEFTGFLSDVRSEMRKVVVPSRKEVEVTTTVVIITVFLFGVYFFVTDYVFRVGINSLLTKFGAIQ